MNDTETSSPAQHSDLESQVALLQKQVFLLLLALIVVSATVVFYLWYQSRILISDYTQYQKQATEVIKAYNGNKMAIDGLTQQLTTYGQTHPEFQPVLRKYGLMGPSGMVPTPQPAPVQ
jgi:hypothetical protein